ncbi:MAG: hypothetical protein IPK26_06475 [Planctomycetes bacterium]|nr:hypothetical protein [Planctomycetota bacterium]
MNDDAPTDELRQLWASRIARLDRMATTHELLVADLRRRRVRSALLPSLPWRLLEIAGLIALIVILAPIVAAHPDDARYQLLGHGTLLAIVVLAIGSAFLALAIARLDVAGPVTSVQRRFEHLRIAEVRTFRWALTGGALIWLPLAALVFEACTGTAALAALPMPWLLANLAFGGALVLGASVASRAFVERLDAGPRGRRWLEALSGKGLRQAAARLRDLEEFARPEGPAG